MSSGAKGRLDHIVREFTVTLTLSQKHFRALRELLAIAERDRRGNWRGFSSPSLAGPELEVWNEVERLHALTKPYKDDEI